MLKKILKCLVKHLFRVSVHGRYQGGKENGHKTTLVIANHTSFLDGLLLYLYLPDDPVFVINTEISESPFFRIFLRHIDYLPIDPTSPMNMKKVINLLSSGRTVVIFPEGRITITGALMKVYSGAAFAAAKTQATIIPVQITGAKYSYFSRLRGLFKRQLFPKISIHIFEPTQIVADTSLPPKEQRAQERAEMQDLMMNISFNSTPEATLYQTLIDSSKRFGKNTLLFQDGISKDLTRNKLKKSAIALSYLLKPQLNTQRIGLFLPNTNIGIVVFYALQHLGKVPAMINYTAGIQSIKSGINVAQITTIITSKRFLEKADLSTVINQLNNCKIIYLEDIKESLTKADKLNILLRQYVYNKPASVSPHDEAVVIFTSGSEGAPKGVVHSHFSLLSNVSQARSTYDFKPTDKLMICLPTFHILGLLGAAVLPIKTGAKAFLYPSPLHYRTIPEIIYNHACTVLISTSTFLSHYAKMADPYDLHSLRYVVAGAEKLSHEVVNTYTQKFGIRVFEGYGTTETAPIISLNTMINYKERSVGKLLPNIDAELLPVKGIDKENTGRLIVNAPNAMLGYLKIDNPGVIDRLPEVSKNKRRYDTGDIVHIDEDGFLFVQGRIKRFAKIAGEMISLDNVEQFVIGASPSHHHAVINIPDQSKGEALVLFTTDTELNRKALITQAKYIGISELSIPKTIKALKEIPVFSSGKTNYIELKSLI